MGEDGPLGFLGSFVQQVGFEPPALVVAVGAGRAHHDAMRASGGFAVSVLDPESRHRMGACYRPPEPGADPFAGLGTARSPGGQWVLTEALAWIECAVRETVPAGDHVLVVGEALAGALLREGDPLVHLRRNGFSY